METTQATEPAASQREKCIFCLNADGLQYVPLHFDAWVKKTQKKMDQVTKEKLVRSDKMGQRPCIDKLGKMCYKRLHQLPEFQFLIGVAVDLPSFEEDQF